MAKKDPAAKSVFTDDAEWRRALTEVKDTKDTTGAEVVAVNLIVAQGDFPDGALDALDAKIANVVAALRASVQIATNKGWIAES